MGSYTVTFTNYTIGEQAYEAVNFVCSKIGKRVLIIGGKNALEAVREPLHQALATGSLELVGEEWYGGECTYGHIQQLATVGRAKKAEMIFGVGGGKAIDTAKGVADTLGIPVFSFPTIASTCAAITALSVVYREDSSFESFYFFDQPPAHCFLNSKVIAQAPQRYFRAGMGDAMAKHFECVMASRGQELNHSSGLAREISRMCVAPILKYGLSALDDVKNCLVTEGVEQVILATIITTGMVSMLTDEGYNGAVAHSLFYGFTVLPGFEEHNLHGDVVAYSVLVQLALDQQWDALDQIYPFVQACGMPTCLADMGLVYERTCLEPVLQETLVGPDMKQLPYEVTADMIFKAMAVIENDGHHEE